MNLKYGSSEEVLQKQFCSMYAFVGAHLISYANIVTRSFPFPLPTSRLCRSKEGMMILSFPVNCRLESISWWVMYLKSSSSRSIHISWSCILLRRVSYSVTLGLISTKNPSECSLWDINLSWRRNEFFFSVSKMFSMWVLLPWFKSLRECEDSILREM